MHVWPTVLHVGEVALGGVWLLTGFIGTDRQRFARQLARSGVDPRAAGPSLWIQRAMGALLLAFGVWGLARP